MSTTLRISLVIAFALCLTLAVTTTTTAEIDTVAYDANGNCTIERDEVVNAVKDYFAGTISRDDVVSLVVLYFSGEQVCDPDPLPDPPELASDGSTATLSALIERVRPSVVMVVATNHNPGVKTGSGLIFSVSGQTAYILTNQHVVDWSKIVQVVVNDEDTYEAAVLGRDAARDLAVVRICCGTFQAAEFGDAEALKVGDDVFAVGYPMDGAMPRSVTPWYPLEYIPATVTKGIVSAFRYETSTDTRFIQHDVSVSPGNSGGPLFSMDDKVVGTNTWGLVPYIAENISFSISTTTVREQLAHLLEEQAGYTFGPISGEMWHDDDGLIDFAHAGGFWARDVDVQATFTDPLRASEFLQRQLRANWSYGFMLRARSGEPRLFFIAHTSSGLPYFRIVKVEATTWNELGAGKLPSLRIGSGNLLRVVAEGNSGRFYVNGTLVWQGGLGGATHWGYLAAGAGFHTADVDTGHTEFTGFQGRSLD